MFNINKKRLEDTFIELVEINSPSFREREIASFLVNKLESCGFNVQEQDYGKSINLIGKKNGQIKTAPPLLLNAHMDTVEPTEGINVVSSNEIIKTSGSTILGADDKGGIVQILEAMMFLNENKVEHGDIEIVFTSGEEKFLTGAKELDFSLISSKHAIIVDVNGSSGLIVVGAPTHDEYTMVVHGKAAHSGIEPENGISAIKAMAHIVHELPDGRIDDETTANVGCITGGSAVNIVPKESTIHGEIRSHNVEALDSLKDRIFNTASKIADQHRVDLKTTYDRRYIGFKIDENDSFLKIIKEAFLQNNITPTCKLSGGGSDANVFNMHGIKSVNIGCGYYKPHTTEEYTNVNEMCENVAAIESIIGKFSKLNRTNT